MRLIAVSALVALSTGCPTTRVAIIDESRTPVKGSDQKQKVTGYTPTPAPAKAQPKKAPVSVVKKAMPLKYFTKVSPARIVMDVINETKTGDFDAVGRAVAGAIANSGYEVSSDKPYLVVSIRNSLGQFDKLGNSVVYKGKTEITINRTRNEFARNARGVNTLLARTKIKETGKREFSKDDAIDSLADKLAEASAKWVADVSKREMAGIISTKVEFEMAIFRAAFADLDEGFFTDSLKRNQSREQKGINLMLRKVANFPGVLSCVETARNKNTLTVEFVYRKKNFPHGLVNKGMTEIQSYQMKTLDGRVNELIGYLFRK